MELGPWLDAEGRQRTVFAGQVQVHPITVTKWCGGRIMPRPVHLQRIKALTGGQVTETDFLEAVTKRHPKPTEPVTPV
jgi:DNA-binding transcriptional regulator YdaS (Cro superfamily)